MNLQLMKRFYTVAKEGTIDQAAAKLCVAQSSLSRSIQNFEYEMKTVLFDRTHKGLKLTPQGERLYAFAVDLLSQAHQFEKTFYDSEEEMKGEIRIVTTPFIGSNWLITQMAAFSQEHPQISYQLSFEKGLIRHLGESDVGICPLMPEQEGYCQEFLFSLSTGLFASPSYLSRFGTPETLSDLVHHRFIAYKKELHVFPTGSLSMKLNNQEKNITPHVEADTLEALIRCAQEGMGIAELPDILAIRELGLMHILQNLSGPQTGARNVYYFIFHNSRKKSKKILALMTFLKNKKI